MPFVTAREMLSKAQEGGYAVGASVSGHLGCFCFLPIVNNAAVKRNMGFDVILLDLLFKFD